jgi:hypothetical protein
MQIMAKRQTKRTPEVEERIIDGLSNGVALRVLCRQDDMPAWRTVYDWMRADEEFAAQVACARDLGFEALAEDILDIADNTPAIGDHVQLAKMRIDTRLKLLACWSPKRYGNKQTVDVGNKEGETLAIDANVDNVAMTKYLSSIIAQQPGADTPDTQG